MNYGTRSRGDKSGAYLFLPDGPARPKNMQGATIKVVQGKLM